MSILGFPLVLKGMYHHCPKGPIRLFRGSGPQNVLSFRDLEELVAMGSPLEGHLLWRVLHWRGSGSPDRIFLIFRGNQALPGSGSRHPFWGLVPTMLKHTHLAPRCFPVCVTLKRGVQAIQTHSNGSLAGVVFFLQCAVERKAYGSWFGWVRV